MGGETEGVRLVEKFYECFNSGDFDSAMEAFEDDVQTVDPGAGPVIGADAFRAYIESWKTGMPDGRLVIHSIVQTGHVVATEGVFSGTNTGMLSTPQGTLQATGKKVNLPFADFYTLRDGKIATHHVYYDNVTFMGQLGLMPEPATTA